jgi:ubiquinol-cytochrome c reductase cytochrome c subunit
VVLLLLGLFVTGGLFSLLAPKPAEASVATGDASSEGKKLFLANCATCHGLGGWAA